MAPLGLGDELRIALISGSQCWGVLCLHREDTSLGFDDDEIALLRRLGPHFAAGLQRAVALYAAAPDVSVTTGPGIIVLGSDCSIASVTVAIYDNGCVDGPDAASLLLRLIVGVTLIAHGYNHVWGGGRLAGTGRWFESIGIRPGRVNALLASVAELAGGAMLVLGLLTPFAAATAVGTMAVALVANHLKNGFFIFRPGEGYEYVLMIVVVAIAIGALGGGDLSLDNALELSDDLNGWLGLAIAGGLGCGGAAILLATCWRRPPTPGSGSTST